MDNKKFTSWGVSFGSLALVAGMVSYLGITNGFSSQKTNSTKPSQTVIYKQPDSGQQDGSSQSSPSIGSSSENDDSASTSIDNGSNGQSDQSSSSANSSSGQNDQSSSNSSSFSAPQQSSVDTTTGGS